MADIYSIQRDLFNRCYTNSELIYSFLVPQHIIKKKLALKKKNSSVASHSPPDLNKHFMLRKHKKKLSHLGSHSIRETVCALCFDPILLHLQ